MQLIRPTSEFEVGHLPFQGKVKGVLPQPYFNWDIPLKDYLTFISIDLVWIPNNLAALEGNEPP